MAPTFSRWRWAISAFRTRQRPSPFWSLALHEAAEAVVGPKRVAAGGDEIEHTVELGARQVAVGGAGQHFGVEGVRVDGFAAAGAHDVLGQDVARARALRIAVEVVVGDRLPGRLAFQHLEAVGRHEEGVGGLVEPVVGPADALDQAGGALGRGELDHEVHRPPVDAEVERRGADHRAQLAPRHGGLDLAPLFGRERPVVQRDRKALVVELPQRLEGELGLEAGVDEDERGRGPVDRLVDLGHGVARRPAAPGHGLLRNQHVHDRGRAGVAQDQLRATGMGRKPPAQHVRVVDGGRQAGAPEARREVLQARKAEVKQVAALGAVKRVDLVDDHALEVAEPVARALPGAERAICSGVVSRMSGGATFWRCAWRPGCRRCGSRCGSVGPSRPPASSGCGARPPPAPSAARRRGCARRAARGWAGAAPPGRSGWAEAAQRLAAAGRRDQQGVLSGESRLDHLELMSARAPAAGREPRLEARREGGRSEVEGGHGGAIARSCSVSWGARSLTRRGRTDDSIAGDEGSS